MVSFAMMVAVTHFTESMITAELKTSQVAVTFDSLDDLVKNGKKLCGLEANKIGFALKHPGTLSTYVSVRNADEGLEALDTGTCQGAILTSDEWANRKKHKSNCGKHMLPATLFTKANVYAMRSDLVVPFTWAMTRLQEKGIYSQLADQTRDVYLATEVDECGLEDSSDKNNGSQEQSETDKTSKMLGPVILSSGVIMLTFVMHVTRDLHRNLRNEARLGDGRPLQVPSLRERLCCSNRAMSRRKSLTQDIQHLREGDRDLKMIAKVFEARHETEERLQNILKGDSPLTVSDVPMLVHLFKESTDAERKLSRVSVSSDSSEKYVIGVSEHQATETRGGYVHDDPKKTTDPPHEPIDVEHF